MSRKDKFHQAVRRALEKENWLITHDPFIIQSIAKILTEQGVPTSDIVIGFHSPFKRQFSGYAVH
jgi:hypothetical protein